MHTRIHPEELGLPYREEPGPYRLEELEAEDPEEARRLLERLGEEGDAWRRLEPGGAVAVYLTWRGREVVLSEPGLRARVSRVLIA